MAEGQEVITDPTQYPTPESFAGRFAKENELTPEVRRAAELALKTARIIIGEPEVVTTTTDFTIVNGKHAYVPELGAHVGHMFAGGGESMADGADLYNGTEITTKDFSIRTTDIRNPEALEKRGSVTIVRRTPGANLESWLRTTNSTLQRIASPRE